jgi:hypothetical protein
VWDAAKIAKCKAAHAFYDLDGSGSISYKELQPALERYSVSIPKGTEAIDYILAYDTNPDGKLDYSEFEELVRDLEAGTARTKPLPQNNHLSKADISSGGIASLSPVLLFASADADGSGSIDFAEFEKLHSIIVKETSERTEQMIAARKDTEEAKAKGRRARKQAICASMIAALMLFVNAGLTLAIVFLAKDTITGGDGRQLSRSGAVVQTGTLEEVFSTPATAESFDRLVLETDLLRTRPTSVIVDFADGSMVQFPPLTIQIFNHSAHLTNMQVGVRVSLRREAVPIFEFTGSSNRLTEQAPPTSAADATARATNPTSLSAVHTIRIIRKLGGFEEHLLGDVSSVNSGALSVPLSQSQVVRSTLLNISTSVNGDRIPLVEETASVDDAASSVWLLELNTTAAEFNIAGLCTALMAGGATSCGTAAEQTRAATSGQLSIEASKLTIQSFRDAAGPVGSAGAFAVLSINRELEGGATIAGLVRHLRYDAPHPIHLEQRRSVREALHSTVAGRSLASAKASAYTKKPGTIPEVHRRRLGWGDADFLYSRSDVPTNKNINIDCYNDQNPGAYAGTSVTTTHSGATCATWASVASAFGKTNDAAGICAIWRKPVLSTWASSLDANHPRVPCEGFLGERPWCMYQRANGRWSASTGPSSQMPSCSYMFLEEMRRAYQPGHAKDDTSMTPINPEWFWGLDRIQQQDAVYDTDPNALLFDGSGVHVFVVDTGCNLNHVEFAGRVGTSFRAYSVGDEGPVECPPGDVSKCPDNNGHGTHCASTILGAQAGVAPGAILHCVDVFDPARAPSAGSADSRRGLEWIVDYYERELRPNGIPALISASMGGKRSRSGDLKWRKPAEEAGILTLVSAGNDDWDACTKTPAGLGGDNDDLPLLTIGASNVDDSKALFSNWGSCVSLWAPGTGILAAKHDSDTAMTVMSGTSMSTPVAAGVAALAMEVALDASMQQYSHMSAATGLTVKNWMLFNALRDKITAIAPSSIVPVSFVSTLISSPAGQSSYVVRNGIFDVSHCATGDDACLAEAEVNSEQANVESSPNLLAHVPDYMQDVPEVAEPLFCEDYDERVYEEDCPEEGLQLCGDQMGVAPDGTSIMRPYRKVTQTCTFGCTCAAEVLVSYETCAFSASSYSYSNRPCAPVYKVDTEEQAAALSGLALTWSQLPGGEAYDAVDVAEEGLDPDCINLKANKYERVNGVPKYTFKTRSYTIRDNSAFYFSTTYSKDFLFYGEPYKKITLYNNGYFCLGKNFVPPSGRFGEWTDHFDARRGPCFSFLMTNLEPSVVQRCSRVKKINGRWVADSLTFTFTNAKLFGAQYTEDESAAVTVQFSLVFGENKIVVRYGDLSPSVTAIIGPSKGEGVPFGFESALPSLPISAAEE